MSADSERGVPAASGVAPMDAVRAPHPLARPHGCEWMSFLCIHPFILSFASRRSFTCSYSAKSILYSSFVLLFMSNTRNVHHSCQSSIDVEIRVQQVPKHGAKGFTTTEMRALRFMLQKCSIKLQPPSFISVSNGWCCFLSLPALQVTSGAMALQTLLGLGLSSSLTLSSALGSLFLLTPLSKVRFS